MANLVVTEEAQLEKLLFRTLEKYDQYKNRNKGDLLFTVNQVAKRLGKAHSTIKKLAKNGLIKTTKDGLISEAAINEYLQKI